LTDDEVVKLNHDGILAKLVSINISYKPRMFAAAITECAYMSHVSMAQLVAYLWKMPLQC
jgi:hypothetical protein